MLLPIGHEETTVRRMPWVTLTIIGACLVTFILTVIASSGEERVAFSEQTVVEYFLDHPYLELDENFKGYTYYFLKQQRDHESARPPDNLEELRLEQRELDALVASYHEVRGGSPYFRWGLVPTYQRPIAWFTHMLMHVGLLHLFGNLFILYLAGPPLEDSWGHFPFAVFYVIAGLVAAFFFIAGSPDLDEPLIGASGAISGVMGAFAVRFWNTKITFFYFFFFFKIYTGTFRAPAWLMLGFWVLAQIAFASGWWAFMSMGDMGNVAFEAHIAGFVFGVAVAFLVQKLALEERFIAPMIERQETVHEARSVERALDLAREGQTKEAVSLLEGDLDRNPRDTDAASALWTIAATVGGEPRVAWRMVPALEASARTGDDGLPALCWGDLLRKAPDVKILPATAVRLGEIVLAAGLDADVATTLHWLEDRVDPSTPVGQLIRLARMADRLGIRAPYAELALARPELPPEVADELRAAIDRS